MNSSKVLLSLMLLVIGQFAFGQNHTANSKAKNAIFSYRDLGNVLPDSIPLVFAPGIISVKDYNNHTLTISPDGKEIYFTRDPLNIWSLKKN